MKENPTDYEAAIILKYALEKNLMQFDPNIENDAKFLAAR